MASHPPSIKALPVKSIIKTGDSDSAGIRLISVYELFYEICKMTLEHGEYADLLPLTIVNRAVSEVARDVLWERQSELANLMFTVPRARFQRIEDYRWVPVGRGKISPRKVHRVILYLPEPFELTEAEYARFFDYARRIKVFEDRFDYIEWDVANYVIEKSLFSAILKHGPILPNVHTLRLGSSTAELALTTRTKSSRMDDKMGTFASLANIRALSLMHEYGAHLFEEIAHMCALPYLEELHLIDFEKLFRHNSPDPAPRPESGALRELSITSSNKNLNLADARRILRVMSSEPLRLRKFVCADFEDHGEPEQLDARRFYGAMGDCINHDTLASLQISTGRYGCVRADRTDIDGALHVLSRAWSQLEELEFWNRRRTDWNEPELKILAGLAQRCPRLKLLCAPLDTTHIPEPVRIATKDVLAERRVDLLVQDTRVPAKKDELVRFIDRIFPAPTLGYISAQDATRDDDRLNKAWWKILDGVYELKRQRSPEIQEE
ncbi:hypothetical protein FB107DRAFT_289342 [Schizophyllum commune]